MDKSRVNRVRSMKSVATIRLFEDQKLSDDESVIIYGGNTYEEDAAVNKPRTFEEFLPAGCKKLRCPHNVVVLKEYQKDDDLKPYFTQSMTSYRKSKRAGGTVTPLSILSEYKSRYKEIESTTAETKATSTSNGTVYDDGTIFVTSYYDYQDRLAGISLNKTSKFPRVLALMISRLVPHFRHLTKLLITNSGIDVYTIHEISKALPFAYITDISLDGCPLAKANYAILLDSKSCLCNLSLSRCSINDEVCFSIAEKLHPISPAEAKLMLLNLSSNNITDVGAKHLSDALRTNRQLRYLNLAGNHLTDEGAASIFDVLVQFPLTSDEIIRKRERFMAFLKQRKDGVDTIAAQLRSHEDTPRKSPKNRMVSPKTNVIKKSKSTAYDLDKLAKTKLVIEDFNPFRHPYEPKFVKIQEKWVYCIGNSILCYLNLAYNHLTFPSLTKLLKVMRYQTTTLKASQTGLLKVILDGNDMPEESDEMMNLKYFMNRNLMRFGRQDFVGRPSSRVRRKSKAGF